jgi:hypothetical protein
MAKLGDVFKKYFDKVQVMKQNVTCPYCNIPAKLVKGNIIYPHRPDLSELNFWKCDCGAYVGCHKANEPKGFDGIEPLGRLANEELRKAKSLAHKEFDSIWKDKYTSRTNAYKLLAEYMDMTKDECHIGMFDLYQCNQVVKFVYKYFDRL